MFDFTDTVCAGDEAASYLNSDDVIYVASFCNGNMAITSYYDGVTRLTTCFYDGRSFDGVMG